jgi:hypothetical protein
MNTKTPLERLVTDALRASARTTAPDELVHDILVAARRVPRRPRWLALLTERPMRRAPVVLVGSPGLRAATILAAVLATTFGSVALAAGGFLSLHQPVVVAPGSAPPTTVAVLVTPTETPLTSPAIAPSSRVVAYIVPTNVGANSPRCQAAALMSGCWVNQIWLANGDGTNLRQLSPDDMGSDPSFGWSADGSRLLYGLVLADPSGAVRQTIDENVVCAFAQKGDPFDPNACTSASGFALSPDGTRVAFVRERGNAKDANVVAILDLGTGNVTELTATTATNGSQECWKSTTCQGVDGNPRWAPDGSRLVFARQVMSPEPGASWTSGALFSIKSDGTDLQRLTPKGMDAFDGSWSPDGATLVFVNTDFIVNADRTSVTDMKYDVYTVHPDGTGLTRLTTGGTSALARWAIDGRVTFVRAGTNWIMNADGSAPAALGTTLPELTAAGCTACVYPVPSTANEQYWLAAWQPIP